MTRQEATPRRRHAPLASPQAPGSCAEHAKPACPEQAAAPAPNQQTTLKRREIRKSGSREGAGFESRTGSCVAPCAVHGHTHSPWEGVVREYPQVPWDGVVREYTHSPWEGVVREYPQVPWDGVVREYTHSPWEGA